MTASVCKAAQDDLREYRWSNQSSLTLWNCFKKFRVSDNLTVFHVWHTVRLLELAPEVGASVYAGYVEDSYGLQRHAAQVQVSPTTLVKTQKWAVTVVCITNN